MSQDTDTPEGGAPAGDAKPEGLQGQGDEGSKASAAGTDTPLDSSIMGGKYGTVGELVDANAALQKKHDVEVTNPPEPAKPDDPGSRPVTMADLETREKQNAEQVKLDHAARTLGLNDDQKKALEAYGLLPENSEVSWGDLAVKGGFTSEDRVAKAQGMGRGEMGSSLPGTAQKTLADAKTVDEVNATIEGMTDEEFLKETNAMAAASSRYHG